jgi:hypothetical protein
VCTFGCTWEMSVWTACTIQVAVDINHHKTMHDLHQRVNPQEVIVGWCEITLLARTRTRTVPTVARILQVLHWADAVQQRCTDTGLLLQGGQLLGMMPACPSQPAADRAPSHTVAVRRYT